MLIVESDEMSPLFTRDPLLQLGSDQLSEAIERLATLIDKSPQDEQLAFHLCDNLCEATRELLFRLHRISASELHKLIDLFDRCSEQVRSALEHVFPDTTSKADVEGYLKHIDGRIELLKRYQQAE